MRFRLLILFGLIVFQNCSSKKNAVGDLKQKQKQIDSLWTSELVDSLAINKYYLKNFGITQQGQTIRLDNLHIDNWPNELMSFHDLLLDSLDNPVASQDWVADAHEGSCLSRHYFDSNGQSFARLISNYYYNDSAESMIDDKTVEYFDSEMTSLGREYYIADDNGNKVVGQVGKPKLDGHQFPLYKSFGEFAALNKIGK